MIYAGEQSGRMDVMMNRLAAALEQEYNLRRIIKKETWYPAFTAGGKFFAAAACRFACARCRLLLSRCDFAAAASASSRANRVYRHSTGITI